MNRASSLLRRRWPSLAQRAGVHVYPPPSPGAQGSPCAANHDCDTRMCARADGSRECICTPTGLRSRRRWAMRVRPVVRAQRRQPSRRRLCGVCAVSRRAGAASPVTWAGAVWMLVRRSTNCPVPLQARESAAEVAQLDELGPGKRARRGWVPAPLSRVEQQRTSRSALPPSVRRRDNSQGTKSIQVRSTSIL
jgi:hypothetical protein